ncbi:MAG: glycosyltransferase family 4 protein [Actinobacteria bacterium]|nr:glycosyltransferase family 4 protein [Actinomycetota bacterium]
MDVAFVVQRYGAEVAGGAEALCRDTARALVRAGESVTVFTTTARDYLAWDPFYPEGVSDDDGVEVRRFAVDPPNPQRSADLVRHLGLAPGDPVREAEWAMAQGPVSRDMLAALSTALGSRSGGSQRDGTHDVVACWTYLYATSQLAMPLVRDRAVLVPLAHEEPMLRFTLTRGVIRMAKALAFMTPEERQLVVDTAGVHDTPGVVVGAGLDPSPDGDAERARRRWALPLRFALYLGRVDAAKGVEGLIRAHRGYVEQAIRDAGDADTGAGGDRARGNRARGGGSDGRTAPPGTLGLLLAGREAPGMDIPPWVTTTGFITDEERADLLAAAEVVVLPSPYESLSLVALEAWRARRPTLGYARAQVVAGQTARSGGGLLYTGPDTYARQLARLAANPAERQAMGESGRAFAGTWTWDACVDRWREVLALA